MTANRMRDPAMTLPTVGVCGFGRCGSTMVMTMLAAGGIPTVPGADSRSRELGFARAAELAPAVLAGRAVKLLDSVLYPDQAPLPKARRWMWIWLDRDGYQQARSQVKLLRGTGVPVPAGAVKQIKASYRADRPRALAALGALGPVHVDSYERALAGPAEFAAALAAFLAPALPFDPSPAAEVVHHRSPGCAHTLEFERTGRPPAGPYRPHECARTGKLAHPDRAAAEAHRAGLAQRDPGAGRLNVYRCGRHWHVGHHDTTELDRRIRKAIR